MARVLTLYQVRYLTVNQKTRKPSGTSGTIIAASSIPKARYIFKCSHLPNTKIKYKIISIEKKERE
jgi:hypothetical protein